MDTYSFTPPILTVLNTVITQFHSIAMLPLTPQDEERKLLSLSYLPTSQLGIFLYGEQQLRLVYTREETIVNNTQPEGKTRRNTQPEQYQIPCVTWVNYFGDWSIEEDKLFCASGKLDSESDVSRESRYFSGFKFDEVGVWRCSWEKERRSVIYNSTFSYSEKVELVLNLLERVGHYTEYNYADTSS